MLPLLPSFIRFLEDKRLLDFSNFNFGTRLKIQKYVYLSRNFGLELGYSYSMYRYGPYSTTLADDYYNLSENPERVANSKPITPNGFRENEFLQLVDGRDNDWLEVAATLVDQSCRFTDDIMLVDHVESIKCNYSSDFINSVLHNLQTHRVL